MAARTRALVAREGDLEGEGGSVGPTANLARAVAGACLAISMPVAVHGQADSLSPVRVPEIHATGSAEIGVRPDLAILTLSFSATGISAPEGGRAVAARADSIRRSLMALGIPRDSLVSASRWSWWRGRVEISVGPPRQVSGPRDPVTGAIPTWQVRDTMYRVHETIEARISEIELTGAVIDTALAYGITEISNVRFVKLDVTDAQVTALGEATRRARRQAAAVAEASGGRLGRVLLLSTPQNLRPHQTNWITVSALRSVEAPQEATHIVAPLVRVRVTVVGRWEFIEDG